MGKKRKTPFGRNVFTLVFILVVVLIIGFVAYTIQSYVTVGNEGNVTPYETGSSGIDEEVQKNIIRVEAKDFNKFNVLFKCTDYNVDKKTADFEVRIWKNENTANVTSTLSTKVCMASDWVGFCQYSSSRSLRMADDEATAKGSTTYRQTYSISSIIDYPAKANTFPIPVTVSKPDFYFYIDYKYTVSGKTVDEHYVIHYAYGDFTIESGGLRA